MDTAGPAVPADIEELVLQLDGGLEWQVQRAAARGLGALATPHADPAAEAVAAENRRAVARKGAIRPLALRMSQSERPEVQEAAARALLHLLVRSSENTSLLARARGAVGGVLGLLGSQKREVRRLATSLTTMLCADAEHGRPAVLREGGVERLADQLLDDPSPEPALKALCALAFEDVEVSLAISNAAVTRHAMTGTIGDESPILLRLVDLLARGAMLQEWSASLVFNLSSNSASIAARLVAAGAESALSAMVGSSSATNLGRKYASNALPLLEAASSSSAPALGGIEGMSALSQHVQAIVAERDRAVAERDQAVAALRQGGGGTSHAAAATPASVLPALQGTVVVAPYVPEPEPTAPSTPRSVMRQADTMINELLPRVDELRAEVDADSSTAAEIDDRVQATLDHVDRITLTLRGHEENFQRLAHPPMSAAGVPLAQELAQARKGLRALRDEVAELSDTTAPPADEERTEHDVALLELAEMLQALMSAAQNKKL